MARKPENVSWFGFTQQQADLLDFIDFLGNNGWDSNGQTDEAMPNVLAEAAALGLTLAQVKAAMESIGYSSRAVHQLDRWESKRTTGRFGR